MRRTPCLLAGLLAVAAADPALAQTRFALQAGVLVPFGNLEETSDPSLRALLRFEYQPVNALGQHKLVSVFGYLSYTDLVSKPDLPSASEPDLLGVGGGLRFYSRHAPLFVGAGAGYTRWDGGDADAVDGLDLQANAGFLVPLGAFYAEVEASLHEVVHEKDDFQYAAGMLGVAMPF